jgi:hypothetical protein
MWWMTAGNVMPIYDPATTQPNSGYDPTQPISSTNLQYNAHSLFPGNIIPANAPRSRWHWPR